MKIKLKLSPNSQVAAAISAGSTGHRPVPSGDSPLGTESARELFHASVSSPNVLAVPSGQWPDGTGESPVLPTAISDFAQFLLAAALVGALGITSACAQSQSGLNRPLTLAPADTSSSGGGDAEDQQAELAKKLQNPVADLISVPIQNNWDFGIGPADAMKYTANIQPVIPVSISADWNVIVRTILPVIYAESPTGGSSTSGLGDITQSFFFSPKAPVGGWILGAGPVMYYPSATESALGAGRWGAGPTIVALRQEHGFTYGILANQIWSYAGWGDEDISATFLQPFVTYTTKHYTTFGVNTESTYDWEHSRWTVPLNFFVQQLVKIGKQPIAFQVGYRYYAERPNGGPDWGLRFAVTFLFPK